MPPQKKKLSEMSLEELQEHLREEGAETLAESITEEPSKPAPVAEGEKAPATKADVGEMIKEALSGVADELGGKIEESQETVQERAEQIVAEREVARGYETVAVKLLKEATDNGFSESLAEEIRGRYALLPSGPTSGLKVAEGDLEVEEDGKTVKKTAEQIIEARVRRDVDHGIKILRESGADVEVKGFGASEADPNGEAEEGDKGGKGKTKPPTALEQYAERHGLAPVKVQEKDEPKKETA